MLNSGQSSTMDSRTESSGSSLWTTSSALKMTKHRHMQRRPWTGGIGTTFSDSLDQRLIFLCRQMFPNQVQVKKATSVSQKKLAEQCKARKAAHMAAGDM
jgi:hypothetical protein